VRRWPWQIWLIVVALAGIVYVFAMVFVAASQSD
jgi:hypothetical protein